MMHDFKKVSDVDIFQLLTETSEKERQRRRKELIASLGVKEFFEEGNITIDKRTCKGIECKLCIKACPTCALFWKAEGVEITKELCIYCGACVLSCIVDDCIRISRKRENGEHETFSTPRGFTMLQQCINAKKRLERVKGLFPTSERFLGKYKPDMVR